MPEAKSTVWYDGPRVIYLRAADVPNWWAYRKIYAIGETSGSWLAGYQWGPEKYAKRRYREVAESEYRDAVFARDNISRISAEVRQLSDVAKIRQIAELIGYREGDNA